jgi:hypothetical protein
MEPNQGLCVGGPLDGQTLTSDQTSVTMTIHVDSVGEITGLSGGFVNAPPASARVTYKFFAGVWVYQ